MILPQPPPATATEYIWRLWALDLYRYLQNMAVTTLAMTVSNPPTQAEVQDIADKLDLLIGKINKAE